MGGTFQGGSQFPGNLVKPPPALSHLEFPGNSMYRARNWSSLITRADTRTVTNPKDCSSFFLCVLMVRHYLTTYLEKAGGIFNFFKDTI
jgi:hypothetical protein